MLVLRQRLPRPCRWLNDRADRAEDSPKPSLHEPRPRSSKGGMQVAPLVHVHDQPWEHAALVPDQAVVAGAGAHWVAAAVKKEEEWV